MLTIQFEDSSLCEAFYNQLLKSMDTYGGVQHVISIEKIENHTNLCINFSALTGEEKSKRTRIASIFTNMTIQKVLPIWFEQLLREGFHYEDTYEIEAIVEHARDLLLNAKDAISLDMDIIKIQKEMFLLYDQFLEEAVRFSFDSFLRFRLREIKEKLTEVLEKAIDEYKLEHSYQIMVQTCRDYLKDHPPRIHTVHLYVDQEITMVDMDGAKITSKRFEKWLTKELNFEDPLPISERVVGPLVCIAPQKIIVYPNRHYEGLIQSLLTIFEERVELREDGMRKSY
ncbi:putative sporulation protein YtxC [Evansella sp. AB-rgal1]|uniref:putative sporulation protein YtxC n=1 Tax=Evansella sp. AB-rgal1 TaxID=3242696 RepID=UPI00359E6AC2